MSSPPVVSGIQPCRGPAAGGTAVTIAGLHFTGATGVTFRGPPAARFTVDSDSQIAAVSPAGSGTVDVTVMTPYGTSATASADQFSCAARTFPCVTSGYWAYADIEVLAAKGIVSGFTDGTFRPGDPVTRAQFVKMLDLTLGLKPGSHANPFLDVPSTAWFAPYVSAAVQAGIVDGLRPTTFGPNEALTREQMAVRLARALKLTETVTLHFKNAAQVDAWALRGEEAAAGGYMNNFPANSFRARGTATRAQAARVLAAVLQRARP